MVSPEFEFYIGCNLRSRHKVDPEPVKITAVTEPVKIALARARENHRGNFHGLADQLCGGNESCIQYKIQNLVRPL